MIDLCTGEGQLPRFERDVVIDSKNSGVILDGGSKADKEDCTAGPAALGLWAKGFNNGFDFKLNGGKNFEIRNIDGTGILICGGDCDGDEESLGQIELTGVIMNNVVDHGIDVGVTDKKASDRIPCAGGFRRHRRRADLRGTGRARSGHRPEIQSHL